MTVKSNSRCKIYDVISAQRPAKIRMHSLTVSITPYLNESVFYFAYPLILSKAESFDTKQESFENGVIHSRIQNESERGIGKQAKTRCSE